MTYINVRKRAGSVGVDTNVPPTFAGTGKGFAATDHAKPHAGDLLHEPLTGYALIDMGKGFAYSEH